MNIQSPAPGQGFQFPGRFEIAAMGAADAGLIERLPGLLEAAGVEVDRASLRSRPSSRGRYVSVTVAIHCQSRDDYEAAHAALRACPEVKWTL